MASVRKPVDIQWEKDFVRCLNIGKNGLGGPLLFSLLQAAGHDDPRNPRPLSPEFGIDCALLALNAIDPKGDPKLVRLRDLTVSYLAASLADGRICPTLEWEIKNKLGMLPPN